MAGYLKNTSGPVSLVLDLYITHDRFGSTSDPSINGHLHYPNDVDRSLNESVTDKLRHSEFACLVFLQTHRETDRFFETSGVSACAIYQWVIPLPPHGVPHNSNLRLETFSPKLYHYGLS